MKLKQLCFRPMSEAPDFKGKGVKLQDILLRDKQGRVWDVCCNSRTFPKIREKYSDATGWLLTREIMLPEDCPMTLRREVWKDNINISYTNDWDLETFRREYQHEAQIINQQLNAMEYYRELISELRGELRKMEAKIQGVMTENTIK